MNSTFDDWEAAVCSPGSFQRVDPEALGLRGADWAGICGSQWRRDSALMGELIHTGHYTSLSQYVDKFLGALPDFDDPATWAYYQTTDDGIYVFLAGQAGSGPALAPLKQFGFEFSCEVACPWAN
jgi:hypothetical protein